VKVVATLRNPRVRAIHPYSGTPTLTGVASGSFDWDSKHSPRAVRIHIVRRTGALAAQHLFLGHPWCLRDSDRGIAWGVLATPSIRDLLRVVRGHDVEEEINSPRYLIGAMGEGATRLGQDPEEPLPLRQLIFLNRDDDLRAWLLANNGHDPLDLLVLESRPEDGDDLDETPEPPNGRYPFSTATFGMNRQV